MTRHPTTVGDAVAAILVGDPDPAGERVAPLPAPVTLTVEGLRVESEANAHAHWRTRQRRAKSQHELLRLSLSRLDRAAMLAVPRLRVTFTRVMGKRGRAFDDDNLVGAFKHCRDCCAAWLGRNDRDPWYEWVVSPVQDRGREFGVRITFEAVRPAAGVAGEGEG
jgi:hypothetical protein